MISIFCIVFLYLLFVWILRSICLYYTLHFIKMPIFQDKPTRRKHKFNVVAMI
jgi:hypothetical protein